MTTKGLPHRSDHSYDERDDLFFDSDDERDSADVADNSDEGKELSFIIIFDLNFLGTQVKRPLLNHGQP